MMKERTHILQAKFLLRSLDAPDDTLLFQLLPYIRTSASGLQWYKLTTSPLWRLCTTQVAEQIDQRRNNANSVLLSACCGDLKMNPILWLPMTPVERSRLICWRLGWLPGGLPKPCIYHPFELLTRTHATECLHIHRRLYMPRSVADPMSCLLNLLPTSRKTPTDKNRTKHIAWSIRWPIICQILHELDYLHHDQISPDAPPLGQKLISWLFSSSSI